jgi:DNA (cytosine-5)-methyltransferase 1
MLNPNPTDPYVRMAVALNTVYGYSQERIADMVGVSFTTVSGWVRLGSTPQSRARSGLLQAIAAVTADIDTPEKLAKAVTASLFVQYGSPDGEGLSDPVDQLFRQLLALKASRSTDSGLWRDFRATYKPWSKLLKADLEAVQNHLKKTGHGSTKAKVFIDIAAKLNRDHGSVTLSPLKKMSSVAAERYLMDLPGVGILTARMVMLHALGHDVVPVDGETYRVAVRLGIVPTSRNPDDAHGHFDRIVPKVLSGDLHRNFAAHAREVCVELKPKCNECCIRQLCQFASSQAQPITVKASAVLVSRPASRVHPTAADIYAGCGGLSAGLRDSGFHVAYAIDWDKHACATHHANFPETQVVCSDVRKVRGSDILAAAGGSLDLLAGGPNCQGVSQRGLRSPDDPRNFMFPEFLRLVEETSPRMILMENVPGLAHRHNFGLLKTIFQSFQQLGFRCAADVLLAANYGVPQLRYRFFMIGTRGNEPLTLPNYTHATEDTLWLKPFVTLGEAIADLPPKPARLDQTEVPYVGPPATAFQRWIRDGAEGAPNHTTSNTEPINLDRAKHIPEGGNWKDIPAGLLPPRFFECRLTDHSTTYARPRRDSPSFTITSLFGNITAGAFTHPVENRAFTVREGARLQSFKDTFRFEGPSNSRYRQIGNAVPPLLGMAVGQHLKALLAGQMPDGREPRINWKSLNDPRAWDAMPVLTPRFKALFGAGTRWPKGWGPEPKSRGAVLDDNYKLLPHHRPKRLAAD